jgi:hypothetical protein
VRRGRTTCCSHCSSFAVAVVAVGAADAARPAFVLCHRHREGISWCLA